MSKHSEELYEIMGDIKERYIEHADKKEISNMEEIKEGSKEQENEVIILDEHRKKKNIVKIVAAVAAVLIVGVMVTSLVQGKDSYIYKTFFEKNDEKEPQVSTAPEQTSAPTKEAVTVEPEPTMVATTAPVSTPSATDVFTNYYNDTIAKENKIIDCNDKAAMTIDFAKGETIMEKIQKLNGVIGYEIVDLDQDSKEEMMVFSIEKQDKAYMLEGHLVVIKGLDALVCTIYEHENDKVTLACKQVISHINDYDKSLIIDESYGKVELVDNKYIVFTCAVNEECLTGATFGNGIVYTYSDKKLNLFYICCSGSDGISPFEEEDTLLDNYKVLNISQEKLIDKKSLGGKILLTYLIDNKDNYKYASTKYKTYESDELLNIMKGFSNIEVKIGKNSIEF